LQARKALGKEQNCFRNFGIVCRKSKFFFLFGNLAFSFFFEKKEKGRIKLI